MDRRQQIENIIIGTLLNDTEDFDWYSECKSCISPSMFQEARNMRIYTTIAQMKSRGLESTTPADIMEYDKGMADLAGYMFDIAIDNHFYTKKARYNSNLYYTCPERHPNYTQVTFTDYVNRFVKLVYSS